MFVSEPENNEDNMRSLTSWERSLLSKAPIIAPDGYVPNSVVRRRINFVQPETVAGTWHKKQGVTSTTQNLQGDLNPSSLPAVVAAFQNAVKPSQYRVVEHGQHLSQGKPESKEKFLEKAGAAENGRGLSQGRVKEVRFGRFPSRIPSLEPVDERRSFQPLQDVSVPSSLDLSPEEDSDELHDRPVRAKKQKTKARSKKRRKKKKPVVHKEEARRDTKQVKTDRKVKQCKTNADPETELEKEKQPTLLEKIVEEKWFPPGVPPLMESVLDELIRLIDSTNDKVFAAVCDYLVKIFQDSHMASSFLYVAVEKLREQLSSLSAFIRKTSLWALKTLDVSSTDIIFFILLKLLAVKNAVRKEMVYLLIDALEESHFKPGLTHLMRSLGISKSKKSKSEQRAAVLAVYDYLQAEADRLKSCSDDVLIERAERWLSSLCQSKDTSTLTSDRRNEQEKNDSLVSNDVKNLPTNNYTDRLSKRARNERHIDGKHKEETVNTTTRHQKSIKTPTKNLVKTKHGSSLRETTDGNMLSDDEVNTGNLYEDDIQNTGGQGKVNSLDECLEREEDEENGKKRQTDEDILLQRSSASSTDTDYRFPEISLLRSNTCTSGRYGREAPQDNTRRRRASGYSGHKFSQAGRSPGNFVGQDTSTQSRGPHKKESRENSGEAQGKAACFTVIDLLKELAREPATSEKYIGWTRSSSPGDVDMRFLCSIPAADTQDRTSEYASSLGEILPTRQPAGSHDENFQGVAAFHGRTWTERPVSEERVGAQYKYKITPGTKYITDRMTLLQLSTTDRVKSRPSSKLVANKERPLSTRKDRGFMCSYPALSRRNQRLLLESSAQFADVLTIYQDLGNRNTGHSCGTHCDYHRFAKKSMHHYISISKYLSYTSVWKSIKDSGKTADSKSQLALAVQPETACEPQLALALQPENNM